MKSRALVLGGGGATGNAWLIGIVAGLFDAGLDVTQADLIIGTSAGSTAAAQISGASPGKLLASILSEGPKARTSMVRSSAGTHSTRPVSNLMERTGAVIGAATDATDMRGGMGALLLDLTGIEDAKHSQWRETVAARLPCQRWPDRPLLITAVDAHTGEPIVFDHQSGVKLVDAVAASTAGGFAYRIGDKFYIDGGYRSDVNADLAAGYRRVLVIPPVGPKTRKPLEWGLHLAAEAKELRAHGSRVEVIVPDSASDSAMGIGMNLMDLSSRRPSCEAGYKQGKALAERLGEFWS
ncbi:MULTISPECIES: patatin-like phospholipase family protein [unclassified Mesorhizobium]|uniref:patatin-like phospholipase family protein n=1 Tax=unclassified Mesorhizobium TaxID=325217 RepID=UPI0019D2547A|nr:MULTISPECIES: patatin-like phospholipase family protein [unclassified Mesorhizobium]